MVSLIAHSLDSGSTAPVGPEYDDWRGKSAAASLVGDPTDPVQSGHSYGGDALPMKKQAFHAGEEVIAEFWSGNPSSENRSGNNYLRVQKQSGDAWQSIHGDMDWSTTIRWREKDKGMIALIVWRFPNGTAPGVYRVKHLGQYRPTPGQLEEFEALSSEFKITKYSSSPLVRTVTVTYCP